MTRRILLLAFGQSVVIAAGFGLLLDRSDWSRDVAAAPWFLGYAAAVAVLTLLPPIHVEHRRHASWVTPADVAIPIGLVVLGPLAFVGASMLAEVVVAAVVRSAPIKTLFNLISMLGGFVAAAVVFEVLGGHGATDRRTWVAVLLALVVCSLWDLVSNSALLAIVEGGSLPSQLVRNAPPILLGLVLAAALGLTGLVLLQQDLLAVLLVVPVLGMLFLSSRGLAQQRAERERFEQLYDASSSLTQLISLPRMLALIAAEARGFATGAAAVCWLVRDDGSFTGQVVADDGEADLTAEVHAVLADRYPVAGRGEVTRDPAHAAVPGLPEHESLVWASAPATPVGTVIIVVLRELPPDGQGASRSDVLAAFATHAAAVVANVVLHEDVRRSLDREVARNREKSEFVASVSHELRTPLAAMIGAVQTIRRLGDRLAPDDSARMVDVALSEGARLRRLIEDLLLMAASEHRRLRADLAPVALPALVDELVVALSPVTGGRLVATVAAEVGEVVSDADKLRRILTNLIENAAKYAAEGPIELDAWRQGGDVLIAVSDRGTGIRPEDRERVFERFVQLDQSSTRRQGGTGLGLHLSRELSRLLGGTLTAAASTSGGARFVLKLPVAGDDDTGDRSRPIAATTTDARDGGELSVRTNDPIIDRAGE